MWMCHLSNFITSLTTSELVLMAQCSFKTHIKALEDAKQGAGSGLIECDNMWYLEGTTLTGSSTSTFLSALPPPPQPLFIQLPQLTPTPASIPEPQSPATVKGDDPPAKKKTQVRVLHQNLNLTVPLTTLIDFWDTWEFPRLISKAFGLPLQAWGWCTDCSRLLLWIWCKQNDSLLWLFLL